MLISSYTIYIYIYVYITYIHICIGIMIISIIMFSIIIIIIIMLIIMIIIDLLVEGGRLAGRDVAEGRGAVPLGLHLRLCYTTLHHSIFMLSYCSMLYHITLYCKYAIVHYITLYYVMSSHTIHRYVPPGAAGGRAWRGPACRRAMIIIIILITIMILLLLIIIITIMITIILIMIILIMIITFLASPSESYCAWLCCYDWRCYEYSDNDSK